MGRPPLNPVTYRCPKCGQTYYHHKPLRYLPVCNSKKHVGGPVDMAPVSVLDVREDTK